MKKFYQKNPIIYTLFFFVLHFAATAQIAGDWQYATKAGGTNADAGKGIAVDASGNTYVVGYFDLSSTFYGSTNYMLTTAGGTDIFLAKYDASGNVLWAVRAGGKLPDYGYGISIDGSGNSYITGTFSDTARFYGSSTIQLVSSGAADIFIAKYDPLGNVLWAKKAGGSGAEASLKIKVDAAGNSFIVGYFPADTLVFYGTPNDSLRSNGVMDMFIAKFNPAGNVLWAKHSGGSGNDYGYGLDIDALGNSYATGAFLNTDTFYTATSKITLTSLGSNDIFVAKFDALGNALWAKHAGSVFTDQGNNLAVDNAGNCYVTGNSGSSCTFYGTPNIILPSNGLADIFLAKYDSSGNLHWAKHAGGTASDFSSGISLQGNTAFYITGYFQNKATFYGSPNDTLTSSGAADIFLGLYDTSGKILCVQRGGGSTFDRGWEVANNGSGKCYLTGEFSNTATFPSTPTFTLAAASSLSDVFIGEWIGCTGTTGIVVNDPSFSFYPNPTTNAITINYPNASILQVEILDVSGRIVLKQIVDLSGRQAQVQTNLTNGIYFITLSESGKKTISKKLIVNAND